MNRISVNKNLTDPRLEGKIFCVRLNDTSDLDPKKNTRSALQVFLHGPCEIVYDIDERFCPYRIVWAETEFNVDIIQQKIFYKSMSKIIHINTKTLSSYNSNPNNAVCEVMENGENGNIRYCKGAKIKGPSRMLYDQNKPFNKVWIETDSDIELIGERIDYIP